VGVSHHYRIGSALRRLSDDSCARVAPAVTRLSHRQALMIRRVAAAGPTIDERDDHPTTRHQEVMMAYQELRKLMRARLSINRTLVFITR
jgi:hypothetical protein